MRLKPKGGPIRHSLFNQEIVEYLNEQVQKKKFQGQKSVEGQEVEESIFPNITKREDYTTQFLHISHTYKHYVMYIYVSITYMYFDPNWNRMQTVVFMHVDACIPKYISLTFPHIHEK